MKWMLNLFLTFVFLSIASSGHAEESAADKLKAGEMLRYGLTSGTAFALHLPGTKGVNTPSSSAMPYVAWLPLYTILGGSLNNAYCSAEGDYEAKRTAVMAAAWKLAEEAKANGVPGFTLLPADPTTVSGRAAALKVVLASNEDEYNEHIGWDPDMKGRCAGRSIGFYAGVPIEFDAGIGESKETKTVTPVASAGLIFTPSTYVHILIGVTYSNIKTEAVAATETTKKSPAKLENGAWMPVISVGGSFDVVTRLLQDALDE